eukprot:3898014-Prymnesium_polylepis.1
MHDVAGRNVPVAVAVHLSKRVGRCLAHCRRARTKGSRQKPVPLHLARAAAIQGMEYGVDIEPTQLREIPHRPPKLDLRDGDRVVLVHLDELLGQRSHRC